MHATFVYAIAYASAVGLLLGWRLSQFLTAKAREHLFTIFSKWAVYSVILPRQNGSSDISVLAAIAVILYIIGNIIAAVLAVRSRVDLSSRLARLCLVNFVILYVGGRTSLLIDKVLRLPHTESHFLHRWVGRVSIVEGLIHGALRVMNRSARLRRIDLSLFITIGTMALCSFLLVRRTMYEIFLRTHLLGAGALLVLLWIHISSLDAYALICLSSSAGLLIFQKCMWLLFFMYRNLGSGPSCQASVTRFDQSSTDEVLKVTVTLKRPYISKPGQIVYLTLPHIGSLGIGAIESHPFMVAWSEENARGLSKEIVLLVQCRKGFTRKLKLANTTTSATIDGPYGGNEFQALAGFDTVLFMANGIGIAAHLFSVRYLLLAHDSQTARVRRITLAWVLESRGQINWAAEFLVNLRRMDSRKILTIFVYYPDEIEGSTEGRSIFPEDIEKALGLNTPKTYEMESKAQPGEEESRVCVASGEPDMSIFIENEWCAEAGNMLFAVCGTPLFEHNARLAVRASNRNIAFRNSDFQPDNI